MITGIYHYCATVEWRDEVSYGEYVDRQEIVTGGIEHKIPTSIEEYEDLRTSIQSKSSEFINKATVTITSLTLISQPIFDED